MFSAYTARRTFDGRKSQLTQHLGLEEEQHIQDLPEHGHAWCKRARQEGRVLTTSASSCTALLRTRIHGLTSNGVLASWSSRSATGGTHSLSRTFRKLLVPTASMPETTKSAKNTLKKPLPFYINLIFLAFFSNLKMTFFTILDNIFSRALVIMNCDTDHVTLNCSSTVLERKRSKEQERLQSTAIPSGTLCAYSDSLFIDI